MLKKKQKNKIKMMIEGDRKKRCRTDKLSNNKASALVLFARRRTKVRRVAKFVRSIKHNFFFNFMFFVFLKGSTGLIYLQNPLLYIVLYGLRFLQSLLQIEIINLMHFRSKETRTNLSAVFHTHRSKAFEKFC